MKRPNFLFIITDQLRADHVGFGGNAIVQTPNLDELANNSMVFDRAYVPCPICGPSRRSLLTGQMPSLHGGWDNGTALDWDASTFTRTLRQNGYRTGLIGKSHIQEMMDGPPPPDEAPATAESFKGWQPSFLLSAMTEKPASTAWGEGWDRWERAARYREEWVDVPEDFYGFDYTDLVCGHNDLPSGHYYQWVKGQGLDVAKYGGPRNALRRDETWNQIYHSSVPEELYPTTYVGQQSIKFIKEAQKREQPFFLFASFSDPHHPFCPPGKYYDMYDPDSIPLPETFYDSHEDSMPHIKTMVANRGYDHRGPLGFSISEEQYRQAAAVEYGSITMLDDIIGQMIDELKQNGMYENTVIIFTSDHGDAFGDHGLMLKHAVHYDGITRIPLLVRTPGMNPGRCQSMSSLLDLGQTILDMAGYEPEDKMFGHSLTPLLEDPSGSVRDSVLIEEAMPVDVDGDGYAYGLRTLVTEDARLTIYIGSEHGELYDLTNDPGEINNLFAKPEGKELRATMMEKLAYSMLEHTHYG